MKKQNLTGYILIIISAIIFGCMPLMARYIYADGVDSLSLVLLRNSLSLPAIGLLAVFMKGGLRVKPGKLPGLMVVGVFGCALTPLLLFSSYNYMAGGTATVFHFVYPAVVVALEILILKKKIKSGGIISLLLCVLGIALFYTPGSEISLVGSAFALSSGVAYAIYIFLLGRIKDKEMNSFSFAFYTSLFSVLVLLPGCLFSGGFSLPRTPGGWILTVFFALIVNVGAVVLFQCGTFLIGGSRASILSTFEPITGLAVGYFAFAEPVGIQSIFGAVLVLSASVIIAVSDMKKENSTNER